MSDVARKLDELCVWSAHRPGPTASGHSLKQPATPSLAEVLGGGPARVGCLTYWRVETPFSAVPIRPVFDWNLLTARLCCRNDRRAVQIDPARTVILDIETGGLAAMPVFLIGVILPDRQPPAVLQFLARDYPEEAAILHALAELTAPRDTWVTFNGKSFDEPYLRDRARLHHVALPVPHTHVDLLHLARRAWRSLVPDCRLVTLEQYILKRPRVGDVPSREVPELFHHFMRTGQALPLRPVLEHNRIDLISCAELLLRLTAS